MSSIELRGQTALITGAAKRLGRAIALQLARSGVNLVIHFNTSAREAELLAEEIRHMGVRAWTMSANLEHENEVEALAQNSIQAAGPIRILVNNASIFPVDHIEDISSASLFRNININAYAPLLLMRVLAGQDTDGCIINLLDCRAFGQDPEHASYLLSKRMLFSLTRICSLEFAPGFRVNAVAPGLILPPPGQDESYLTHMEHTNPLHTHGNPEDVAEAVLFLAQSPFVTGQVIFVDGGRNLKENLYG